MTPEDHRRIGNLYRDALALPAEDRGAFVASACHADPGLQRDVESLLAYDGHSHTALDASAMELLGRAIAVEESQSWVGRQISHYLVLSLLGRGGMGEVYRARDVRLAREVAIKVLPLAYAIDGTRLHRFEQESRAAGQLNHPNVVTVHDLGVHGAVPFIVTELLDGTDLRQQLASGALPPERAIGYAQQIARGLAATHAQGIVHRDLKPENLFVTRDGRVKILDFGLAKLAPAGETIAAGERRPTATGLVIGTMGYLAPEQLRGDPSDHRADVFAFGVILHEMLTGTRPFAGQSPADVAAAILKEEPRDLAEAAADPALGRIVRHCLEKDPDRRFQSASDLAFALDMLLASSAGFEVQTRAFQPRGSSRRRYRSVTAVALLACGLGAAIGGTIVWRARAQPPFVPEAVGRFVLPINSGMLAAGDLALAPDGTHVAFSTGRPGAKTLYLRNLADPGIDVLAIDGGEAPFFSPNSRWVGFFADGKMKKVSVHGGVPITLADAPSNRGADWSEHGAIVFAPIARAGLFQVSADGGVPEVLTTPDVEGRETSHTRPRWLPGGRSLVYVARGETEESRSLVALSLDDGQRRVLLEGANDPDYGATGHLLFVQQGTLMAVPFDSDRFDVQGDPIPVVEGVGAYGLSHSGLLMYAPRTATDVTSARLVLVDRQGRATRLKAPLREYSQPRVSPDGRRLALNIERGPDYNIWIYDLDRESLSQLTFEGRNGWPVWSHDGRHVIYASNRAGTSWDVYRKSADGSSAEETLLIKPQLQVPQSVSRDGQLLALTEVTPSSFHAPLLSLADGTTRLTIDDGWSPALSPDGRWVAYVSNESARYEVYVRPTSGGAGKWLISTDGGVQPLWSPRGTELFYRRGNSVFVVDVTTDAGFAHGAPRVLFEGRYLLGEQKDAMRTYDVTPDGQRFLMISDEVEPTANHLRAIVNWFSELAAATPLHGS